ncbi:hypothetical protein [Methylobacterium sp. V23]|uniref:hypothetical protein n=1 Tax=Methylobacterium sp. V23 TaxID=2044878 RepID=UPI0011B0D343|nr:hypothetical protein [Methylobacterium sp. V23]
MIFPVTKRQFWNSIASAETALQPEPRRNVGMRENEISVALSETLVCDEARSVERDESSPSERVRGTDRSARVPHVSSDGPLGHPRIQVRLVFDNLQDLRVAVAMHAQ